MSTLSAPVGSANVDVVGDQLEIEVSMLDEAPGDLRSTRRPPDSFSDVDTSVQVYFDPTGKGRFAQVFGLNAAGGVADGLYRDGGGIDNGIDFVWTGVATRETGGWKARFVVPLSSLYLAPDGEFAPRLFIEYRRAHAMPEVYYSAPVEAEGACLLCAAHKLDGFPRDGVQAKRWSARVTAVLDRTKDPDGRSSSRDLAADLVWQPSPAWQARATLRPSFADRPPDDPVLTKDAQFSPLRQETRSFYSQGSDLDQFRGLTLVDTRQIADPRWGALVLGRTDAIATKWLLSEDRTGGFVIMPGAYGNSVLAAPPSTSLIGRVSWQAERGDLGVLLNRRSYGDAGENLVLASDGLWRTDGGYSVTGIVAGSRSSACAGEAGLIPCASYSGAAGYVKLDRTQETDSAKLELTDITGGFRNDLGWQPQVGYRKVAASWQHRFPGRLPMGLQRLALTPEFSQTMDSRGQIMAQTGSLTTELANSALWLQAVLTPLAKRRLLADGPLFPSRQAEVVAIASPSPVWTKAAARLAVGQTPDYFNARRAHGFTLGHENVWQVGNGLVFALGGVFATARADDAADTTGPTVRENVLQGQINWQFTTFSRARFVYVRDRTQGWQLSAQPAIRFSSSQAGYSFIVEDAPRLGLGYLAGVTRTVSRQDAADAARATEVFVHVSFAF